MRVGRTDSLRIDAFELNALKTLETPLDTKDIKESILKEINPKIFIGSTDAEGEAPILWPPDTKSRLIGKDPDTGKD